MKSSNKLELNLGDVKEFLANVLNDKRRLGKLILILLILLLALGIRLGSLNKEEQKIVVSESESEEVIASEMYVDISGEVNKPGVYIVEDGTRLYEVISKAGGLTKNANTNQINQAGYVEDGEKIVIPSLNDGDSTMNAGTQNIDNSTPSNGLININTAGKDELMSITGVGEVIAGKIIEYRKTKRFKSIEDIMNVKGIGNATYEKMKDEITV